MDKSSTCASNSLKKESIDKVRDKTESSGKGSTRVINSFTDKEFISPDRVPKSLFSYIYFDRLNYVTRWMHIPGGCLGTGGEN